MRYILITGNVVDGHAFWGPFDDFGSAEEAAFIHLPHSEWWIASIDGF